MKRIGSSSNIGVSRSSRHVERQPQRRDLAEIEEKRRQWMRQQEREREHERLKRKKIEEYERKREAQKREEELKNHRGRSSYRSNDRSKSESPHDRRRDETRASTSKTSIMSEKFESSSNNARLFKGPEGTKIDITELRRIKVDIHRNITTTEISNELQRDILVAEDVQVKRREATGSARSFSGESCSNEETGRNKLSWAITKMDRSLKTLKEPMWEGSKPIFEREELKKSEIPVSEVEETRTVVSLGDDGTERRQQTTRKRSATPTSPAKRSSSRRHIDDRDSRYESSRQNANRLTNHRSHHEEGERDRGRSKDCKNRSKSDDTRERRSPRRTSHDVGRDHRDRRNRSNSGDRESGRGDNRRRSSRDTLPYRDHGERSRDDSRDGRNREDRSRERRIQMSHHYAEAMPVPLYYESFHPMVGPMLPMRGQMPIGRGRMPPMMVPMRHPYPPRFLPPEMFRQPLHPNPRFNRMF